MAHMTFWLCRRWCAPLAGLVLLRTETDCIFSSPTQLGDNYNDDNLIPEEEEYPLSPPWKGYVMSKSNGCDYNSQNEMEGTGGQKGRDRQEVRLVRKRNSQKSGIFLFFFSDFTWF